jgi:hypothetical protein
LASALEAKAVETTVELNMQASSTETKVETNVAKKKRSPRNRALNMNAYATETKVKTHYLRRTTNAAANNCLGTTIKYLENQNAGAGNNWAKAHKHKSWNELR